ncbi:MAG: hypothetical protein ACYST2_06670, partial [Planctomycetota bacterium]
MKRIHPFLRTKTTLFSLLLAHFILWPVCSLAGTYGGGTGQHDDPYLIATAADMNEIGVNPDDWDKSFVLVNNIDLSAYKNDEFNIIGTDYYNSFQGIFDGNNHTISNFTYESNSRDNIGLFGYVFHQDAEIKNL